MLIALLLAQAAPMAMPAKACPAAPTALAAEYAGWGAATPVAASADAAGVGDAMLTVGQGARATLQPAGALKLPATTGKPLSATAHGGVFAFEAATGGRYRIALGAGAWVDVVANGAALPSAAHGHGPDCTPVRKYVDYDLKPGRYLLQITGELAALTLMIAKLG